MLRPLTTRLMAPGVTVSSEKEWAQAEGLEVPLSEVSTYTIAVQGVPEGSAKEPFYLAP